MTLMAGIFFEEIRTQNNIKNILIFTFHRIYNADIYMTKKLFIYDRAMYLPKKELYTK